MLARLFEIVALPPTHEAMKAAEDQITKARFEPGFSVTVLQLVLSENVSPPARQLAAILFKQAVDDQWKKMKGTEGPPEIPKSEKKIIRENALQALMNCPPEVSKQLQEAVKTIVMYDWPKRWPNIIPLVVDILKNHQEPKILEGALICYSLVIQKYSWKQEKRSAMYTVVEETFPLLLQFLTHLRSISSVESLQLQKIICKSFFASFQLKMPPYLRRDDVLEPWLAKFMEILMSPLPPGEPADPDARSEWAPWKAKKWALHVFLRMFVRFGDPLIPSKKSGKKWAKQFTKKYATKILQGVLQIVDLQRSGVYLPDQVICDAFRFISASIQHSSTWPIITPYGSTLVRDVLFPMVCFNQKDYQIWTEDPQEYIRREYDLLAEYRSVKSAALDVLCTLAQVRSDETFNMIMDMVVSILQNYTTAPESQRNPHQVEGALNVLGVLSDEIIKHPVFSQSINDILGQYLFPHLSLQNTHGFVVARACWAFGRFCNELNNSNLIAEGLTRCLGLLRHPELPTRVQAALSLKFLVETEESKPILQNSLGELFQIMFSLINEEDNDDLVSVLDAIIFEFRHSISPFAVSISEQLTKELFRLAANINSDDDDLDLYKMAASECGRALLTVLASVRKTPQLYPEIFRAVSPFLNFAITSAASPDLDDLFSTALKILAFISYFYPKPLPQELWEYIPAVAMKPVDNFEEPLIEDMVPFFDNMMTREPQLFLQAKFNGISYLELVWKMILQTLEGEEEGEGAEAVKLMEVIFQSFRGEVDFLVGPALDIIAKRLEGAKNPNFQVLLYASFGNVLFYNPQVATHHMDRQNLVSSLLGTLLVELEKGRLIKRAFDNKQVSLGLSSLLQVPAQQLPSSVQALFPKIIQMNMLALSRINEKIGGEGGEKKAKGGTFEGESLFEAAVAENYTTTIREDDDDGDDGDDGDDDGVNEPIEDSDSEDENEMDGKKTFSSQSSINLILTIFLFFTIPPSFASKNLSSLLYLSPFFFFLIHFLPTLILFFPGQGEIYDLDGDFDNDDDDDDFSDGLSDSDNEDYEGDSLSPIDRIDELALFMTTLQNFVQREGAPAEQLMANMGIEVGNQLREFEVELNKREARRNEV